MATNEASVRHVGRSSILSDKVVARNAAGSEYTSNCAKGYSTSQMLKEAAVLTEYLRPRLAVDAIARGQDVG